MVSVNLINRIHRNSSGRLVSGYLLNGVLTEDENVPINRSISGTIFHSLRLMVDNRSLMSTRVYLDDQFIGSVQEHFVPRLKGGVFVTHKFRSVGLFRNFKITTSKETPTSITKNTITASELKKVLK